MDECLRGIEGAIAYLDNIYVTGQTEKEHIKNLQNVCARLQECGLRVNKEKCKIMQEKIEVLGYVIDKNGLHKAKSKVLAVVNAPQPKNQKELVSFLGGLVTFYSRFLSDRSNNLKPLYDLLNKKDYSWDENCSRSFNWVKDELISPRVLAHYDPKQQIILACGASDYGISAILSHKYADGLERPIAYASKKITKKELSRSILDKEAMAIVFGCKRFYQFIFGKEFILRTDNKALRFILGPRRGIPVTADNRLQRWAYYLSGFRHKIEHVKSEENANCDALSRLPVDCDTEIPETNFSSVNFFEEGIQTFDYKTLADESRADVTINKVIRYTLSEWPHESKITDDIKCYYSKKVELAVDKGCLFGVCVQ